MKAFFWNQLIRLIWNLKIQETKIPTEIDWEYKIPEEYFQILSSEMLLPKEEEKKYPNNTTLTSIFISPENLQTAIILRVIELLHWWNKLDTLSLINLRWILEYLEYEKWKIILVPKSWFFAWEIVNIHAYR